MKDTLTIQCLVQAMNELNEATREHDEARDQYIASGGYSWGYYGARYVRRMEEKAEEFETRLQKYIDQRVDKTLRAKLNLPHSVVSHNDLEP